MGSDDWLDKLLREKQDRKQAQEDERRLESARKAKLEALIDSYWTTVKAAISDMVKKYNQKIQGRGNELSIPHARLDMLVLEKRSSPPARLTVRLLKPTRKIHCHADFLATYPDREFQVRVGDADELYMEDPSGKAIAKEEIARVMLEHFLAALQRL